MKTPKPVSKIEARRSAQADARDKRQQKQRDADYRQFLRNEKAAAKRKMAAKIKEHPLPEGVLKSDLTAEADYDNSRADQLQESVGTSARFELWYIERLGWCVPTLSINNRMRADSHRTYGVCLKDGSLVTMGQGPHVLAKLEVMVNKGNAQRLGAIIDRIAQGAVKAHVCRDRISTRRVNSIARRRIYSPF